MDYHRSNPTGDESEYFITAVEDFAFHAAISVRETEHLLKVMQEQFSKALVYFGEDPNSKELTTDKFLGIFEKFLKTFAVSSCSEFEYKFTNCIPLISTPTLVLKLLLLF